MYSIRYYLNVPKTYLDELFDLFDDYIEELKEDFLTHENICELTNEFGVSLLFSDKKPVGFYLASKEMTIGQQEMCFIHHAYIAKGCRRTELIKLIESDVIEMAKSMGVMQILFMTTRNVTAFMRLGNKDWKVSSTILKLDI